MSSMPLGDSLSATFRNLCFTRNRMRPLPDYRFHSLFSRRSAEHRDRFRYVQADLPRHIPRQGGGRGELSTNDGDQPGGAIILVVVNKMPASYGGIFLIGGIRKRTDTREGIHNFSGGQTATRKEPHEVLEEVIDFLIRRIDVARIGGVGNLSAANE